MQANAFVQWQRAQYPAGVPDAPPPPTLPCLFLGFGGTNSVLPEMQRQVVEVHSWLTAQEFAALSALAQAAPGPNMLVVSLIGWRVAGLAGALVTTLGVAGPSSVLTFIGSRLWYRFRDAMWRRLVQRGLVPVTAGLAMASTALLIRATAAEWRMAAITVAATLLLVFTRLHPLLVLGAAAVDGRDRAADMARGRTGSPAVDAGQSRQRAGFPKEPARCDDRG